MTKYNLTAHILYQIGRYLSEVKCCSTQSWPRGGVSFLFADGAHHKRQETSCTASSLTSGANYRQHKETLRGDLSRRPLCLLISFYCSKKSSEQKKCSTTTALGRTQGSRNGIYRTGIISCLTTRKPHTPRMLPYFIYFRNIYIYICTS